MMRVFTIKALHVIDRKFHRQTFKVDSLKDKMESVFTWIRMDGSLKCPDCLVFGLCVIMTGIGQCGGIIGDERDGVESIDEDETGELNGLSIIIGEGFIEETVTTPV